MPVLHALSVGILALAGIVSLWYYARDIMLYFDRPFWEIKLDIGCRLSMQFCHQRDNDPHYPLLWGVTHSVCGKPNCIGVCRLQHTDTWIHKQNSGVHMSQLRCPFDYCLHLATGGGDRDVMALDLVLLDRAANLFTDTRNDRWPRASEGICDTLLLLLLLVYDGPPQKLVWERLQVTSQRPECKLFDRKYFSND